MGITNFFKKKKRVIEPHEMLKVPAAPGSKNELPTFPSADEIPDVREFSKEEELSAVEKAEKYAVEKQEDELEIRDDLHLKKPIFVYLDLYKELMNELSLVQSTLKEGTDSLSRVGEFKEDEDKEFSKWESQIKDIQRKLIYADKTLFAAQK